MQSRLTRQALLLSALVSASACALPASAADLSRLLEMSEDLDKKDAAEAAEMRRREAEESAERERRDTQASGQSGAGGEFENYNERMDSDRRYMHYTARCLNGGYVSATSMINQSNPRSIHWTGLGQGTAVNIAPREALRRACAGEGS